MSMEQNMDQNHCDSAELCIKRLSRKLSEVEIVMTNQEGKANQMRKERDVERAENEELKKEIMRLRNELLRERMNSAQKEKEIKQLQDEIVKDDKLQKTDNIDSGLIERRRASLPVSSKWKQIGRKASQDHPRDMKKLLDKRSNELLQQRQQYRIFENRFQQEAQRCNKLDRDLERLNQLLVDLLGLHGQYHSSSVFQCNGIVTLGKGMKGHCTALLLFSVSLVLVLLFVFLLLENDYKGSVVTVMQTFSSPEND